MNIYRQLNGEWARLSSGASARRAFQSWADPRLEGIVDPAALVVECQRRDGRGNEVLEALIAVGEDLALRAALEALLPLVASEVRRSIRRGWVGEGRCWSSAEDLDADLVAEAWLWLQSGRAVGSWPASRLQSALRHRVRARVREREAAAGAESRDAEDLAVDGRGTVEDVIAAGVVDAFMGGRLSLTYAQLLYGVAVRGETATSLAAQRGVSPSAVWNCRYRDRRGLQRAVEAVFDAA